LLKIFHIIEKVFLTNILMINKKIEDKEIEKKEHIIFSTIKNYLFIIL
jgi:Mn-dependent DtxR family transcriptional regulator